MPHDYANTVLANRYHLRRCIGFGGMATVYEAIDRELNKPVAVKILNPQFAIQPEYLARFKQEAREAARIRHEHLVDVTDQGMSDNIAYFVMEFLRGDTLQGYLHPTEAECRQVPWRTMVQIVAQVCDALQHAHDHGVIHRDIKPANCFLITRRSGEFFVKVLDLGIAKVMQEFRDPNAPPTTRASQGTPGTPEYMSPEQVIGEPVTSQSDLYSLGVVMYRMLTGRLPFYSERSPYETMEQHCKHTPVSPRERAPEADIPESISREVMRALAKRPEDRHATAQELGDTLRAIAEADARRALIAGSGDDDDARTQQYQFQAPHRSFARTFSYAAASFAGLTLSTSLFMLLTLIQVQAQEPPDHRPTAVAVRPPPADLQPAPKPPVEDTATPETTKLARAPAAPRVDPKPPDTPPAPNVDTTVDPPKPTKQDPGPKPDRPRPPPPPASPEKKVTTFLQRKGPAIARRCDSTKPFPVKQYVALSLVLDPSTGRVGSVSPLGVHARTPLGSCAQQAVANLKFPAPGGTQTTFVVTLTL
jgi:hypothetical protein